MSPKLCELCGQPVEDNLPVCEPCMAALDKKFAPLAEILCDPDFQIPDDEDTHDT